MRFWERWSREERAARRLVQSHPRGRQILADATARALTRRHGYEPLRIVCTQGRPIDSMAALAPRLLSIVGAQALELHWPQLVRLYGMYCHDGYFGSVDSMYRHLGTLGAVFKRGGLEGCWPTVLEFGLGSGTLQWCAEALERLSEADAVRSAADVEAVLAAIEELERKEGAELSREILRGGLAKVPVIRAAAEVRPTLAALAEVRALPADQRAAVFVSLDAATAILRVAADVPAVVRQLSEILQRASVGGQLGAAGLARGLRALRHLVADATSLAEVAAALVQASATIYLDGPMLEHAAPLVHSLHDLADLALRLPTPGRFRHQEGDEWASRVAMRLPFVKSLIDFADVYTILAALARETGQRDKLQGVIEGLGHLIGSKEELRSIGTRIVECGRRLYWEEPQHFRSGRSGGEDDCDWVETCYGWDVIDMSALGKARSFDDVEAQMAAAAEARRAACVCASASRPTLLPPGR